MLIVPNRVAFRINHDLFSDDVLRQRLATTADEVLHNDPDLHSRLQSQLGRDEMRLRLLDHLKHAAPFKFPEVLGNDEFDAHCSHLSIPTRLLDRMTTLVVLPLLDDENTSRVVERAVDELVSPDNIAGSALLFLRGISRLRIYDRVRGSSWLVLRHEGEKTCRLANGAKIEPILTASARVCSAGQISRNSTNWWRIRRQFGREGDNANSRDEEVARIKRAVSRLPVGLREIRTAHASVALPRCPSSQSYPERFAVAGRISIGLPTRVATGTPAWLDGPFHGNVARTDIDLEADSQPYNRLIFKECVRLFWQAIEHVKTVGEIGDRRGILFWFASEPGALTTHFVCKKMLSSASIVLSRSGTKFLTAEHLKLPEDEDVNDHLFETLFGIVPNLEAFGFRLPDPWLMQVGREIIDSLMDQPSLTVPTVTYIDRPETGKSLIETACHISRNEGSEWWERFFHWLTERIRRDDLRDQAVLPIVGGKLVCPVDRVFFRPLGLTFQEDQSIENNEDEEIIDDLDATLASSLRFLDEECVRVRVAERPRDLTELARKLSPDGAAGLVRRPRRPEIINEVLVPALKERAEENPRDPLCIKLLECIGAWLTRMSRQDKQQVQFDKLLAPTTNDQATWAWRPAYEIYLGPGWVGDPFHDHLLECVLGHRIGARMPSWEEFERWLQAGSHHDYERPDRAAWRRWMEEMGVHAHPRVLVDRPKRSYFKSWSYDILSLEGTPPCPFDAASELWPDYLNYLCQRPAGTCSGQSFFANPLSWVDGLEHPDTREAVMEMVLRWPEKYEQHLKTNVQRQYGQDSQSFSSLWMWSIRKNAWAVIPSNNGPKPIDTVWVLQSEQRRRRFVDEKLLFWMPEEFNQSHKLVSALGVHSPDEAPIERIASELHQAAERVAEDGSTKPALKMLVQTLYEWLQNRCEPHKGESTDSDLLCLLERPVPLMHGDRCESVDLNDRHQVYLNDDPQRAPHIAGFASGYALPHSAKSRFKALFVGLQLLLGHDRVRRVSEEPIELDFPVNSTIPGGHLLELIKQSLGKEPSDIELQIAALIAYGRSEHPMDPAKQAFRDHWTRIQNCYVEFVRFSGSGVEDQALFDTRAPTGPTIYFALDGIDTDNAYQRTLELIRQSWRVVGPGHRDAFEAFAGALRTNNPREFLKQRGIGDAEWDEVRTAIGASTERGRARLRNIAFALWRRKHPVGTASAFEAEWDESGEAVGAIMRVFDVDDSTARSWIHDAQIVADDEGEADLAENFGVATQEWQESRELLGLERVRFRQTIREFENAVQWVAGSVIVAASRYLRLDLRAVRSAIEEIRSLDCPVTLAQTRTKVEAVFVEALRQAATVVGKMPDPAMARLAEALNQQASRSPESAQKLVLRGVSRRELIHVVDHDEPQRNRIADEAVQSVLKVAKALAVEHGETIDISKLHDDSRLLRHTKGWWANAFAALRVLKKAIALQAPQTAGVLGKRRAFAAPSSPQELWNEFPELGVPGGNASGTPTQPKKQILGLAKTQSEIDADLAEGGDREIERELCQLVKPGLDLSILALGKRSPLDPDSRNRTTGRETGGAGGWRNTQRRDEHELVGYLGERFVHEYFMAAKFSEYDISCWVSENRGGYKGQSIDPIILGCDFRYRDDGGRLTGRNDSPLCLIEVKATTGDGRAPFPITTNEWRLAHECHGDKDRAYVIIRVRQILGAPVIFDVIVDPVKALRDGWVRTRDKDLYLVVGHAIDQEPEALK